MSDPLRDPRYPNRPQHPDYWRMSEIVMQHDAQSVEDGKSVPEIAQVDEASLLYMASNRIGFTLNATGLGAQARGMEPVLLAIYLDAFALGKKFAERGGHRD